jgi:hypothetical protein
MDRHPGGTPMAMEGCYENIFSNITPMPDAPSLNFVLAKF